MFLNVDVFISSFLFIFYCFWTNRVEFHLEYDLSRALDGYRHTIENTQIHSSPSPREVQHAPSPNKLQESLRRMTTAINRIPPEMCTGDNSKEMSGLKLDLRGLHRFDCESVNAVFVLCFCQLKLRCGLSWKIKPTNVEECVSFIAQVAEINLCIKYKLWNLHRGLLDLCDLFARRWIPTPAPQSPCELPLDAAVLYSLNNKTVRPWKKLGDGARSRAYPRLLYLYCSFEREPEPEPELDL